MAWVAYRAGRDAAKDPAAPREVPATCRSMAERTEWLRGFVTERGRQEVRRLVARPTPDCEACMPRNRTCPAGSCPGDDPQECGDEAWEKPR